MRLGSIVVVDTSFPFDIWNAGSSSSLVLAVDIWHPEVADLERLALRHLSRLSWRSRRARRRAGSLLDEDTKTVAVGMF